MNDHPGKQDARNFFGAILGGFLGMGLFWVLSLLLFVALRPRNPAPFGPGDGGLGYELFAGFLTLIAVVGGGIMGTLIGGRLPVGLGSRGSTNPASGQSLPMPLRPKNSGGRWRSVLSGLFGGILGMIYGLHLGGLIGFSVHVPGMKEIGPRVIGVLVGMALGTILGTFYGSRMSIHLRAFAVILGLLAVGLLTVFCLAGRIYFVIWTILWGAALLLPLLTGVGFAIQSQSTTADNAEGVNRHSDTGDAFNSPS